MNFHLHCVGEIAYIETYFVDMIIPCRVFVFCHADGRWLTLSDDEDVDHLPQPASFEHFSGDEMPAESFAMEEEKSERHITSHFPEAWIWADEYHGY